MSASPDGRRLLRVEAEPPARLVAIHPAGHRPLEAQLRRCLHRHHEVEAVRQLGRLSVLQRAELLRRTGVLVDPLSVLMMLIVFGLMTIIVPVMGIIKALNNEKFDYPIVGAWYQ